MGEFNITQQRSGFWDLILDEGMGLFWILVTTNQNVILLIGRSFWDDTPFIGSIGFPKINFQFYQGSDIRHDLGGWLYGLFTVEMCSSISWFVVAFLHEYFLVWVPCSVWYYKIDCTEKAMTIHIVLEKFYLFNMMITEVTDPNSLILL